MSAALIKFDITHIVWLCHNTIGFTWTTNTCIIIMSAVGHSVTRMGAVEQALFFSSATNRRYHDKATSLPIVCICSCQSSCERIQLNNYHNYSSTVFKLNVKRTKCRKSQLSADHTCIIVVPSAITDSAPWSIHT